MRSAMIWMLFLFLSIISFYPLYASDARAAKPDYAPNMVKIKLRETALAQTTLPQDLKTAVTNFGFEDLDDLMLRIGGKEIYRAHRRVKDRQWERETGFDRWFLVVLDGTLDVYSALELCKKSEYVEKAIPEYYVYPAEPPNDPFYDDNWGHNNTAQLPHYENGSHSGDGVGVVGFDSDVELAWEKNQVYGSSEFVIAIIDSGVDFNHLDLATNIWINIGEIPDDGIDNDLNGEIDDVNGYDYGNNDANPMDDSENNDRRGHGTACAGISAGITDNNIGVAGVAGGCSVMPLKVASSDVTGVMTFSAIDNAITYAVDNGTDVISMSIGAAVQPGQDPDIDDVDDAIVYADLHGVILFAATGNYHTTAPQDLVEDVILYPANHTNVIAVGAASPTGERKSYTSSDGESWWGSKYGVNTENNAAAVDIVGPTILPTTDITGSDGYNNSGDYYMWFNGTSCATPYVAGVAALMLSLDQTLTPAQIRTALVNTATDMTIDGGIGWDRFTGYGLVNANAALNYIILAKPMNLVATPISSNRIDLTWSDNSSNETGFVIEKQPGFGQPWCIEGTVGENVTSYQDDNLAAGSINFYRVKAVNTNANTESDYSNTAYAFTPLISEPNDTFASASPINLGLTYTETIYIASDVDYFSFNTVSNFGYTVRLESETDVGVELYVYDQLQGMLSSSLGTDEYKYICSTTGINYIKVVRNGGSDTGEYSLRVLPAYWNGDVQASWDFYHEPNPSYFNSKQLSLNSNTISLIDPTDDEDWFRYTVSEGTQYSLSLQEPSGLGVELYVYDHLLNLLSSDYGANTYSYTCNYDGTHYVKVVRDGGTVTGSYQLLLQAASPTFATDIAPSYTILHVGDSPYKLATWSSQSTGIVWSSGNNTIASVDASGWVTAHSLGTVKIRATSANDPARYAESTVFVNPVGDHEGNDTFASAVLVPVNQKVASRIGTSNDNDYFKFNAVSGYGYTVIMETEPRVGVEFYVYDQLQSLLSSSIGTETYKYVCSTTGVNYIKVVRDGGTLTGDYIFRILPAYWNGDVVATWDSENEPNPYEYNARLLSVNSQTDNHINFSGDIDWFRFGATAGNEYSVSIVQENGVGVELYVYNPDITLLSSSNGTNSYNFTCSVGGIHYIKVVRDGGTATGRYVLAIQSASEPIIAPLPPSQCEMTGSFTSTQLSWAPVNMDVNGNPVSVSYYVIEASDEPNSGFTSIGTTTNTQFGIDSTTHAKRFYRIVAVVQ